jgi:hypothetical protein
MGYTVYNRSLYRNGFRPYGTTNTSAAASGMGGTPFDPEFLHGTHHQHGYPFSERGGWRLGQIPGMDIGTIVATDVATSAAPPAPPSCSWAGTEFDFFFDRNAWQQCQIQNSQNDIQAVADRAAAHYGPNSPAAIVAQQTADAQAAQVPADVASAANVYAAGNLIATPDPSGATIPTWALAALIVGGVMLLKKA